jgi:hypothetical protein
MAALPSLLKENSTVVWLKLPLPLLKSKARMRGKYSGFANVGLE